MYVQLHEFSSTYVYVYKSIQICFGFAPTPCSMLSQVYLYDTHAFGVKFNPTHADFVRVLLKSSSTLHGTEEDVDRIRVCKTG